MSLAPVPELRSNFENVRAGKASPVLTEHLTSLQVELDRFEIMDPYQASATYYAMTGRNGLWRVNDTKVPIFLCHHPNIPDELLIFDPTGTADRADIKKATQAICALGEYRTRLARVPIEPGQSDKFLEETLDWKFPVHTIDCEKVIAHRGNEFQQFRTKLNKLDTSRIHAIDLRPKQHGFEVMELLKRWAGQDLQSIAPYESLLTFYDQLPLQGRLIYFDQEPAAFSIWEKTDPARGLANAYAHIGLHSIPGMSRYVMLDMCKTARDSGFKEICIGGSETSGLDQFKRQMRPTSSIFLGSIPFRCKEFALGSQSQVNLSQS